MPSYTSKYTLTVTSSAFSSLGKTTCHHRPQCVTAVCGCHDVMIIEEGRDIRLATKLGEHTFTLLGYINWNVTVNLNQDISSPRAAAAFI